MGVDGRIGNRAVIQALADALQMEGVKRMPAALNIDQVQLVCDLFAVAGVAQPNYGAGEPFAYTSGAQPLDGSSSLTSQLVATGQIEPGYMRITSIIADIEFDAAGALAFNGKYINLRINIAGIEGDPPIAFDIIQHEPVTQIRTDRLFYGYCLNGFSRRGAGVIESHVDAAWDGALYGETIISSDGPQGLQMILVSADGTNFPANTSVTYKVLGRRSTNGLIPAR